MYRQILENLEKNSIDAYMINTNDEHLNEYIGPSDERLKNITKFTGSNGLILISKDKSYLYTDGRYHIQARTELEDGNFILITEIEDFYSKCKDFATIGINKKQFEQNTVAKLTKKGLKLVDHSIDDLLELPERKYNKIIDLETIMAEDFLKSDKLREVVKEYFNWLDYDSIDLDINVTGTLRHDKFELLREKMKNHDIFIVTALDEVAYLFNLRGNDIVFNPVFYAYAVVTKDEIILFANEDIQLENVQIMKYESFYDHIETYRDKKIYVSDSCNAYAYEKLSANNTVTMSPIIADIKSSKNNVELLGFIQAHIYDGCALSELFDFMRDELHNNHDLTEAFITKKLKTIKEQYAGFFTPSFETISSTGANAAIIHHQGGEDKIDPDQLYLIDSGSQYFFGTTDITRTMVFNEPNQDQKEIFTKVLKQQLRPMLTNLPVDYPSFALDAFSRLEAWDDKIDYEHSLGHGVGHFLNVHESPPSLSKYGGVLKDRMVFSIEPGRYIEGVHGVRIEDLVVSVKEDKFFSFKNITLSPLQENLIDLNMLTAKEQEYVKRYNEKVNNIISKFKIDKENGHENPLMK